MKQLRAGVIGCGNITTTRHIPVLQRAGVEIHAVMGKVASRVESAQQSTGAQRSFVGDLSQELPEWIGEVDFVVVGTPPQTHAVLLERLVERGVHVLMEKPFLVSEEERQRAGEMLALAKQKGVQVGVMHNFQFAAGFAKALKMVESGKLGRICSVQEYQWSTRDRRLPEWYEELPLGLFWDEAAHFFYLAKALLGEMEWRSSHALSTPGRAKGSTPGVLLAVLEGGGVPVEVSMHFDAAISEWGVIICCERGTLVYDLFRDVLVRLPHDGEHLPLDIVRTGVFATVQHWWQVVRNGLAYRSGKLAWGMDVVMEKFTHAVRTGEMDPRISGEAGLAVVDLMRAVVAGTE